MLFLVVLQFINSFKNITHLVIYCVAVTVMYMLYIITAFQILLILAFGSSLVFLILCVLKIV